MCVCVCVLCVCLLCVCLLCVCLSVCLSVCLCISPLDYINKMVSCLVAVAERRARAVVKQRYIELLVVVDHTTLEWHAGQDIESYILTLINLVCATIL